MGKNLQKTYVKRFSNENVRQAQSRQVITIGSLELRQSDRSAVCLGEGDNKTKIRNLRTTFRYAAILDKETFLFQIRYILIDLNQMKPSDFKIFILIESYDDKTAENDQNFYIDEYEVTILK